MYFKFVYGVLKMSKKKNQKNIIQNDNTKNESVNSILSINEEKVSDENDQELLNETVNSSDNINEEIIDAKDDNESTNLEDENLSSDTSSSISVEENVKKEEKGEEIFSQITDNKKSTSKKSIIIVSVVIGIILLLFLFFSTIFALININKNTIINGVYIKGIDVSSMTKEEATQTVSNILSEKLSKEIVFEHNDSNVSLFPEQFEVSFDVSSAVDTAYAKGRKGNIFKNNYEILSSLFFKTNIGPSFSFNEDALNSLITEMEANFSDRLVEPSYYIDGNNLIITKGKDRVVIDSSELKSEISYIINNLECNINTINIPTQYKVADKINLEQIHSEVYRAPQDAYYTKDPYVVHPHVDGIDFAISMEEANNLLNSNEDSFAIPLKVLSPAVTTNQIGSEAFPDLLGSYSTTYSTRNTNRSTNIRLASSKINGIVVMPGETFSYNKTVGKRTTAAGFKSAAVYAGGEVTTGIGGGICQVSSTLYNAVLLANLEIVERHNHGFNTGYVPAGRDATVSWGGPDFVFKNTRDYPIRVVCYGSGGTISCKIFGLKSDNEYQVEIQSYITSYIAYKTITQNDATLPAGTTKVLQNGSNGCRSVAYRILKQNGQVVSKTLLSKDTYNPHNKIVAVGTKQ